MTDAERARRLACKGGPPVGGCLPGVWHSPRCEYETERNLAALEAVRAEEREACVGAIDRLVQAWKRDGSPSAEMKAAGAYQAIIEIGRARGGTDA